MARTNRPQGIPQLVVDVSNFGATPVATSTTDGSSQAPAIQAAIDYAHNQGGGTVVISRPGVYWLGQTDSTLFTALKIYSNMRLVGAPGVVLKRKPGGACYMLRNAAGTSGNDNFEVRGVEFDCNAACILRDGAYDNTTRTCTFSNLKRYSQTAAQLSQGDFTIAPLDLIESFTGMGASVFTGTYAVESATYTATSNGSLSLVVSNSSGTSYGKSYSAAPAGSAVAGDLKLRIYRQNGGSDSTAGWIKMCCLLINCTNFRLIDNYVHHELKFGFWLSGCQNAVVKNTRFRNASDGIDLGGTADLYGGTRDVLIEGTHGICEDNMVAMFSDAGDFFSPSGGPFTAGNLYNVIVRDTQCTGGLTPVTLYGTATYTADRILVDGLNAVINEGNIFAVKDISSHGQTGIVTTNLQVNNVDGLMDDPVTAQGVGMLLDMSNLKSAAFRNVRLRYGDGTQAQIQIGDSTGTYGTNWRQLDFENVSIGEPVETPGTLDVGCTIRAFLIYGGAAGAVQYLNLRNVSGTMSTGGNPGIIQFADTHDADIYVNMTDCTILPGGSGFVATPTLFQVGGGSGGLKFINLTNFNWLGGNAGGQGVFLSNLSTVASSRTVLSMNGGSVKNIVYFASVAKNANNKTRIIGNGVTFGTIAADALNDDATTGELSVNLANISWGGDSYRGTAVKGDRFVNTYTGGAPWAALGAIPVLYDGTNWKAD